MQRLTEEMENQIAEYLAEKYKSKFETVNKQDIFILALVAEVNVLRQTVLGLRNELLIEKAIGP